MFDTLKIDKNCTDLMFYISI